MRHSAAARPVVDETLARVRHVLKARPDGDGYVCRLSCGHEIWIAIPPGPDMYCGECLHILAEQARELAAAQKRPAGGVE